MIKDNMVKLILGNKGYEKHMTDEGDQLQKGLVNNGWIISGMGYDGMNNVPAIIERYKPDVVFIQDKRDWDKNFNGSFGDESNHFYNVNVLSNYKNIVKVIPVKDAGSVVEYQEGFAKEVNADILVTYYHQKSVNRHSLWTNNYNHIVRTYHSVDKDYIMPLLDKNMIDSVRRDKGIVSGAINKQVYPQRTSIILDLKQLIGDKGNRIDTYMHPGYGMKGAMTPQYLDELTKYKVSICTCSKYQFALRKIMEAVSCGCICLTNLPQWDELPVIDKYLVRFSMGDNSKDIIKLAEEYIDKWYDKNYVDIARECMEYYDYNNIGRILNENITELVIKHKEKTNEKH